MNSYSSLPQPVAPDAGAAVPGLDAAGPVVAVVGGGPAGLMAAERLAASGVQVDLYDGMPSVGRKFLLAGRGGLNLTHAEPIERFVGRFGHSAERVQGWLQDFGPQALCEWTHGLGIETFVGSSGRIFPTDMKAAPLLRAWLSRLRGSGVRVHARHRWQGWGQAGGLLFDTPQGPRLVHAQATVLALGGASWPRLGSDGAWVPLLAAAGVSISELRAANCGFDVRGADASKGWSAYLRSRFAGQPLKAVSAQAVGVDGPGEWRRGEFVITDTGVEGSLIYALSASLREAIATNGQACLRLDLLPEHTGEQVQAEVLRARGPRSLATHLKSRLGVSGLKLALLHEVLGAQGMDDPLRLAQALKALPLTLDAPRPVAEAISTAGGVSWPSLDEQLMLRALPGVFCAGEMLDWEAPTGGYLLTASMASGRVAAAGALAWLGRSGQPAP